MKKNFVFVLVVLLGACSLKQSVNKPVVTVSILPQQYFVEKIAGDLVDVNVLVQPGASPATYSLMASQMTDLAESKTWLRIGEIGFEESWAEKIQQSNPDLKIVDTSKGVTWIAGEEEHHEEEGEHEGEEHDHSHGIDPHIWLSPNEAKIIAKNTFNALVELFPESRAELTENYELFSQEIDQLDQALSQEFSALKNRTFFIFHPALTYLARQYNLEQVALEIEGKEPSPRYMQTIVDQAQKENIKVVFIQKEFDIENAQLLANEIDGEVVQIDPLNIEWETQLRDIASKIISASTE